MCKLRSSSICEDKGCSRFRTQVGFEAKYSKMIAKSLAFGGIKLNVNEYFVEA